MRSTTHAVLRLQTDMPVVRIVGPPVIHMRRSDALKLVAIADKPACSIAYNRLQFIWSGVEVESRSGPVLFVW